METTEQKIKELEKQLQELKNEVATQNQPKFKKGDFCFSDNGACKMLLIYDSEKDVFLVNYSAMYLLDSEELKIKRDWCNVKKDGLYNIRFATESEEKLLIDALHNVGKDWDYVNKQIVDYRWRAGKGELYYWLDSQFEIEGYHESFDGDDYIFFDNGNYFKTPELAEAAAEKVKELLLTLKHS